MYTPEKHSSEDYNPGGHPQPGTTQMEYAPEDFSQSAINRGQRKINYALTVVDQRLARTLKLMRDAIAASPAGQDIDWDEVDEAIKEVYKLSRQVADIKPPGCDSNWPG